MRLVVLLDIHEYIDPFPFTVGDKVLVENASVGVGSTASGYNSSDYDYARFEITEVTPNFGGIGTVKYDMSNYLSQILSIPVFLILLIQMVR